MAKRSRAAARPGQMRPTRRPQRAAAGGPAATEALRPTAASAPAEAFIADDAEELAGDDRGARRRDRARTESSIATRTRATQPSALLAARAAQEYSYVGRDVRHIGVVGGGLFAILLVLFLLIEVLHLVKL